MICKRRGTKKVRPLITLANCLKALLGQWHRNSETESTLVALSELRRQKVEFRTIEHIGLSAEEKKSVETEL